MNISHRWLQSLLPGYEEPAERVAERLAGYGAPVESMRRVGAELRDITIAQVVEARQHPNADRLSLCTVDAGGEALSVVCGAPNVRSGGFYPFAPVGATLPGGVTIRRAKIRGEESRGMLCSPRELGLGRDHDGLLPLVGSYEPGASFIASVGLDDVALTIEVTPNRPDLLSHIGVARELAPVSGTRLKLPPIPGSPGEPTLALQTGSRSASAEGVRVSLEDAGACPRYLGAIIRGVRVGPSPDWLAMRLRSIGQRPINNVVDATNYVLHELGQPLHAFDLARLGESVVVRAARSGERIVTLDGVDRTLDAGMLVIADASRPVALAGVMGGEATEVAETTRDLFLECALFDPAAVRRTRRGVGLSTDASQRFERGVDPDALERALRRAVELIVATAGGSAARAAIAAGAPAPARRPLRLRPQRVAQVLGIELPIERIAALLSGIGFSLERAGEAVMVNVPGYRAADVTREDDLVEEVARRHGYDSFPSELRAFRPSSVPAHPLEAVEARLREGLVTAGFLEARTAAFAPEAEGDVALLHPLSAAEGRLRRALLPGLFHRLEHNFARGLRDVRLFEIGTAFHAAGGELPEESTRVAGVLTGRRAPDHWSGEPGDYDIWDLKDVLGRVATALGAEVVPSTLADDETSGRDARLFASGTQLDISDSAWGGARIGQGGLIAAGFIDAAPWAAPVFGFEAVLTAARGAAPAPQFEPLPAFPAVARDLALLVPDGTSAADVDAAIRAAGGALLEGTLLFDLYTGKGIPGGTRGLGFRLVFRSPERTLTDAEVDAAIARVLARLKEAHGIERRG